MNTDANRRIICPHCGRLMQSYNPKPELIRLSCPTHGVMHAFKVVEVPL